MPRYNITIECWLDAVDDNAADDAMDAIEAAAKQRANVTEFSYDKDYEEPPTNAELMNNV